MCKPPASVAETTSVIRHKAALESTADTIQIAAIKSNTTSLDQVEFTSAQQYEYLGNVGDGGGGIHSRTSMSPHMTSFPHSPMPPSPMEPQSHRSPLLPQPAISAPPFADIRLGSPLTSYSKGSAGNAGKTERRCGVVVGGIVVVWWGHTFCCILMDGCAPK